MQNNQKKIARGSTFKAVPSLPQRFSRNTARVPNLEDLTSTHFLSSLKFSSKGSSDFPASSASSGTSVEALSTLI